MPTGGINPGNIQKYLESPRVVACGGSWLTPKDAIDKGDTEQILGLLKQIKEI